jgi:catalase
VAHFQQDGHMAFTNPVGRANYEPNSWGAAGGPREDPARGYRHAAIEEAGQTRRVRSASFADHYSQARLFYRSQTDVERAHIADAFVFELSKVERPDIRARMVANLRNVDETLAATVADGLALELPEPTAPAAEPIDLDPSPALSIVENSGDTFEGRKVGVLISEGTDAELLDLVLAAAGTAGAVVELIAPKVGGVTDSAGAMREAGQMIDGGPSVLYDTVVLLAGPDDLGALASHATALDFVRDAHAHCKFVGYSQPSIELLRAAGLADQVDEGYAEIGTGESATEFFDRCRSLRYWAREPTVRPLAAASARV